MMRWAFVLLLLLTQCTEVKDEDKNKSRFEFNTDVSRLMKIIVNSLYSNKEIFLRELISNCADAMNKVIYLNQTEPAIMLEGNNSKLDITIEPDEDENTLVIRDRGIGMSREELIKNLGTVAKSGTLKFLEDAKEGTNVTELIGQFGVGFYSAFLVATKVVVTSKRYNEKQYVWTSVDAKSFTVEEDTTGEDLGRGTKITLFLNDIQYSNTTRVKDICRKYSQFIDFPIYLRVEQEDKSSRPKKKKDDDDDDSGADEVVDLREPVYEYEHINLHKAIWLRDPDTEKESLTASEYIDFYKEVAAEYKEDPLKYVHFHQTVDVDFRCILYLPDEQPKMEKNANNKYITRLRLYIKRVLITEEFEDFLPRYLNFVRGVIDSDDLPLNVSREMLQESRTLRMMGRKIVRRIIQMMIDLSAEAKEEEEKAGDVDDDEDAPVSRYRSFYRKYAQNIKIGCIEDRENRKKLSKLLRFNTTQHPDREISLDTYIANMKKGQTEIYYIAGDPAVSTIQRSPFLIPYKKKGQDVLFFSDSIDEVVARELRTYEGKTLVSITESDKKEGSSKEKERLRVWRQAFKPLTSWFKQLLKANVTRVDISARLSADPKSPCVLSSAEGSVSANIERLMREQQKMDSSITVAESKKVLELNPRSDLIVRMNKALTDCRTNDPDGCDDSKDMEKLKIMGVLMYETALLDNGYLISDSALYADHVFEVLTKMTGLPHAPVLPDDFAVDFQKAALKEEEEEAAAVAKAKEEKIAKKRAMLKEGEVLDEEDFNDPTFSDVVVDPRRKSETPEERRQRRRRDRAGQVDKDQYYKQLDVEDPDEKMYKQLADRREKRLKAKKAREKAQRKRKEQTMDDTEVDDED